MSASLLSASVLCVSLACASTTSVPLSPTPGAGTAAQHSSTTGGAPASPPALDDAPRAALAAFRIAAARRVERCMREIPCAAQFPRFAMDDAAIREWLVARPPDAKRRALRSAIARVTIEEALAETRSAQFAARRALTFTWNGTVFALDDLGALVLEHPKDRAKVLDAARPAIEEGRQLDAALRTALEARAAALGVTRAALLAARTGIDPDQLLLVARGLRGDQLLATTPLPAGARRTALLDLSAAGLHLVPEQPDAGLAAALPADLDRLLMEPALLVALDWCLRHPTPAEQGVADAYAAELRVAVAAAARAVEHLLAPQTPFDASLELFIDTDESGSALDVFVGLAQVPSVIDKAWAGDPLGAAAALNALPPLDEQGQPAAFVARVATWTARFP